MVTSLNKASLILIILLITNISGQNICKVTVKSNSPKAAVFINNQLKGVGKTIYFSLNIGHYNLRIVHNLNEWDSQTFARKLNIIPGSKNIKLNFHFNNLLINSIPQDALVLQNDSLLGFTPLRLSLLKDNILTIQKEGFKPKKINLNNTTPIKLFKLNDRAPKENVPFFKSKTFPFLIASAIILSGTAAYFKITADNKYSEYLTDYSPSRLRIVNKYDLISGIALGILEINIGYLIYRALN